MYLILMAGSSEARPHYSQTCMVAKVVKLLKREAGRETEGMGLKNGKRLLKRRSVCQTRPCVLCSLDWLQTRAAPSLASQVLD